MQVCGANYANSGGGRELRKEQMGQEEEAISRVPNGQSGRPAFPPAEAEKAELSRAAKTFLQVASICKFKSERHCQRALISRNPSSGEWAHGEEGADWEIRACWTQAEPN